MIKTEQNCKKQFPYRLLPLSFLCYGKCTSQDMDTKISRSTFTLQYDLATSTSKSGMSVFVSHCSRWALWLLTPRESGSCESTPYTSTALSQSQEQPCTELAVPASCVLEASCHARSTTALRPPHCEEAMSHVDQPWRMRCHMERKKEAKK